MISVTNLSKRFGRALAVDGISFHVAKGEIVGFLGPNGAGKTTTMRILSCFMPATGGTVRIAGRDVITESREVRSRIGYLPEHLPLYPDMRVLDYLAYRSRLKGLRGGRVRRRVREVVESCGLGSVQKQVIGRLSRGFRQRVGLADSLVHEPDVLILDEPTVGLDPNQIMQIRGLIKGLAGRHTVLLSSHILPEVEAVCSRVLIINKGRIAASDTPGNLIGLLSGKSIVTAEVQGPVEQIVQAAGRVPGVVKVAHETLGLWTRLVCECGRGADVRESLFQLVADRGWRLRDLTAQRGNLEDVFAEMTAEVEDEDDAGGVVGASRGAGRGGA